MEQTAAQFGPPSPLGTGRVITYAGFWKRLIAYFIDQLLISVVAFIILIPFIGLLGIGALTAEDMDYESSVGLLAALIGAYAMAILFLIVAEWLYFALMESKKGATLGKMALSIKVTDANGNLISFGRATGRFFGKYVSAIILYIGFMMAGWTQQKQALHDIMAGTLVVNKY